MLTYITQVILSISIAGIQLPLSSQTELKYAVLARDVELPQASSLEGDINKIVTFKKEVFAARKVEIINKTKVGFEDYYTGRYYLLNAEEVAVIMYSNGQQKMFSDQSKVTKCLAEIDDLSKYSSREPASTISLSTEEQKYFSRRALKKTKALGEYLRMITDESLDELDQNKAVSQALKLFLDEERLVEVSSLNSEDIISYKITDYLKRLRSMNYARVELLWNQVAYVNNIRRGADGNYRGTISVEQVFKGYNSDNIIVYEDVTRKNIEIIIRVAEQMIDGKLVNKWDVLLSDIGVKDTSEV